MVAEDNVCTERRVRCASSELRQCASVLVRVCRLVRVDVRTRLLVLEAGIRLAADATRLLPQRLKYALVNVRVLLLHLRVFTLWYSVRECYSAGSGLD